MSLQEFQAIRISASERAHSGSCLLPTETSPRIHFSASKDLSPCHTCKQGLVDSQVYCWRSNNAWGFMRWKRPHKLNGKRIAEGSKLNHSILLAKSMLEEAGDLATAPALHTAAGVGCCAMRHRWPANQLKKAGNYFLCLHFFICKMISRGLIQNRMI